MANLFRMTDDGRLDKQYLRICAVGRLVDQGRVTKARAIELLEERRVKNAGATVDIWLAHPSQRRKAFGAEGLRPCDAPAMSANATELRS